MNNTDKLPNIGDIVTYNGDNNGEVISIKRTEAGFVLKLRSWTFTDVNAADITAISQG